MQKELTGNNPQQIIGNEDIRKDLFKILRI
jgi:hypothetical protein